MKLKKLFFIIFLGKVIELHAFCFNPIDASKKFSPPQIAIDEARKLAFHNRQSQKSFDYSIRAGREHELATLTGYFPQLDIQTRIGTVNKSLLLPKKQVSIEGRQLLLSFDGPIDKFRIARQETAITNSRKLLDKDIIKLEVESAALELWDIQKKYDFIKSLEISSKTSFQRDKHQYELGLSDTNTWLTALAYYTFATSQVSQYSDKFNTALTNIERSLGMPISHDFNLNQKAIERFITNNILAAYKHDSDYFYKLALSNRKELLEIDNQILREQYLSNLYAKSYIPEIYLFGQVQYYEFKPLQKAQTASTMSTSGANNHWVDWRFGLEFDWKFDGLGSVFNTESSHATELAYRASKLDVAQQIKKEVYTTYDSLQLSLKELDTQKAQFKKAENEFILRKKQYEIGEISDVEMAQAEARWEYARYELKTAEKQTAYLYRELLSKSGYPETLS